jgi:hypothetical protein
MKSRVAVVVVVVFFPLVARSLSLTPVELITETISQHACRFFKKNCELTKICQ